MAHKQLTPGEWFCSKFYDKKSSAAGGSSQICLKQPKYDHFKILENFLQHQLTVGPQHLRL